MQILEAFRWYVIAQLSGLALAGAGLLILFVGGLLGYRLGRR